MITTGEFVRTGSGFVSAFADANADTTDTTCSLFFVLLYIYIYIYLETTWSLHSIYVFSVDIHVFSVDVYIHIFRHHLVVALVSEHHHVICFDDWPVIVDNIVHLRLGDDAQNSADSNHPQSYVEPRSLFL
jgi:hypothetical protein